MKSKKTVKEVLIVFENAIKDKSWDSWTKLAFLFVIAGETVAEAFKTNEHGRRPEAATELCRGAAEILFSRLVELGSWEDFGVFVQRHNAVYHQQGSECDATGKCVEEKVTSEVLQRFEELTTFFPLKRPCS